MSTTIAVKGVGFEGSVEVLSGESYEDALSRAGFGNTDELDLSVNGESVEAEAIAVVANGDTVIATPKAAALG